MDHATRNNLGRPKPAARTEELCDKWAILSDLTAAREALEVSHTTLGVLKALLTFLPGRTIGTDPRGNTVFPANRTLSHRLNGMPESTLRRHLARLTTLGLVSRRDSPNRKRYARNLGQHREIAFGFDLTPLALMAAQIRDQAEQMRQEAEALRALRDDLSVLRQAVLARHGLCQLTDEAHRLLRRKPIRAALQHMIDALSAVLSVDEMSGANSQNERHLDVELQSNSEDRATPQRTKPADNVSLARVTDAFPSFIEFFPNPVRNWTDLSRMIGSLAPMIGIAPEVLREAEKKVGPEAASVAVLFVLQHMARIQNPGGYFRRLTQNHAGQGTDLVKRLISRAQTGRLSADNVKTFEISYA